MLTQPNVAVLIGFALGYLMAACVVFIYFHTRRHKLDRLSEIARTHIEMHDALQAHVFPTRTLKHVMAYDLACRTANQLKAAL